MSNRQKGTGTIFKRGKTYYIKTVVNKKVKKISLKTNNKKEAEEKADELLNPSLLSSTTKEEIIRHFAEAKKIIEPEKKIILKDVWNAYIKTSIQFRPDSGVGTLNNYKKHWNQFLEWLTDNKITVNDNKTPVNVINDITDKILYKYINYLENKGIADATFNYNVVTIKLIFRVICKKLNIKNPSIDIKQKQNIKYKSKGKFNFEDAKNLLNVFDEDGHVLNNVEYKVLFYIGVYTGLRMADCICLKWSDIKNNVIKIVPQKTKKYNKVVLCPVVEALQDILDLSDKDSEYIMPEMHKRFLTNPSGIRKDSVEVFKRVGYNSNNGVVGFHNLRHAFFSHLCQGGITIDQLKAWSGDSEKTLLKYYLHADTNKMIEDAQRVLKSDNNILEVSKSISAEDKIIEIMKYLNKSKLNQQGKDIISIINR